MTGPLTDQQLDEATARIEHWISEHPSRAYAARFPVDDVQAIIAENTRLHRAFTALGEQTGGFLEAAVAERERYTAENQRLREEADRLRAAWESAWAQRNEARGLLHRFAGHEDTPCWFDHHGDCQEHGSSGPCPVAEARRVLGLDGAESGPQRHAGGPSAAETGTQPQQDGSEAQEAAQPQYLPGHPGKLAQRPDWLDKPERQRTAEEIRIYRLDHCGTCRGAEFYGWFGTVAEQAHAAHLEAVDVGPLAGTPCRCPKHAEAATGYRAVRRQQHPNRTERTQP